MTFLLATYKVMYASRRQYQDSFVSSCLKVKFNVLDRVARRRIDIFKEEIEVGEIGYKKTILFPA